MMRMEGVKLYAALAVDCIVSIVIKQPYGACLVQFTTSIMEDG